jgi:hypothetical protein
LDFALKTLGLRGEFRRLCVLSSKDGVLLDEITNKAGLEGFKIGKMIYGAGITSQGMSGLSVPS